MLLCSAANGYILFSSHATASVFKYMRREILFSLILMLTISRTAIDFIRRWLLLHISLRINISLVSDFFIKLLKLPFY